MAGAVQCASCDNFGLGKDERCPLWGRGSASRQGNGYNASSLVLRKDGSKTSSNNASAAKNSPRLIGRLTKMIGSPPEISIELIRFSSRRGPSTKPSSRGAGSHP